MTPSTSWWIIEWDNVFVAPHCAASCFFLGVGVAVVVVFLRTGRALVVAAGADAFGWLAIVGVAALDGGTILVDEPEDPDFWVELVEFVVVLDDPITLLVVFAAWGTVLVLLSTALIHLGAVLVVLRAVLAVPVCCCVGVAALGILDWELLVCTGFAALVDVEDLAAVLLVEVLCDDFTVLGDTTDPEGLVWAGTFCVVPPDLLAVPSNPLGLAVSVDFVDAEGLIAGLGTASLSLRGCFRTSAAWLGADAFEDDTPDFFSFSEGAVVGTRPTGFLPSFILRFTSACFWPSLKLASYSSRLICNSGETSLRPSCKSVWLSKRVASVDWCVWVAAARLSVACPCFSFLFLLCSSTFSVLLALQSLAASNAFCFLSISGLFLQLAQVYTIWYFCVLQCHWSKGG